MFDLSTGGIEYPGLIFAAFLPRTCQHQPTSNGSAGSKSGEVTHGTTFRNTDRYSDPLKLYPALLVRPFVAIQPGRIWRTMMTDRSAEDVEQRHRSLKHPDKPVDDATKAPSAPSYADESGATDLGDDEPVVPEPVRGDTAEER
jgi:hypothetical protein